MKKNKQGVRLTPRLYRGHGRFPHRVARASGKIRPLTREEIVSKCHRTICKNFPLWEEILYHLVMQSKMDIPLIIVDAPIFLTELCEKILKGEGYEGKK